MHHALYISYFEIPMGSGRKTKGLLAFFVPFLLLYHKIFHYLMSSEC